jgi:alpha-L-fucosidase
MRTRTPLIFLLLACVLAFSQAPIDPLAPTHDTKSAADIDHEWQVSVAKYDAKRTQILREVDRQDTTGPYRADWKTLRKFEIPQWYKDAKFGIFIHWGVFAVPGSQNEWYPRNMYRKKDPAYKEHIERFGPQEKFGYKDFIPRFKAERWDPADWARLFKQAGARYVIPVAEHHDGFAMYASDLSDWSAAKMGPHRDVIGDLGKAVRAEGLHFGTSFHRAEHDWFFDAAARFARM